MEIVDTILPRAPISVAHQDLPRYVSAFHSRLLLHVWTQYHSGHPNQVEECQDQGLEEEEVHHHAYDKFLLTNQGLHDLRVPIIALWKVLGWNHHALVVEAEHPHHQGFQFHTDPRKPNDRWKGIPLSYIYIYSWSSSCRYLVHWMISSNSWQWGTIWVGSSSCTRIWAPYLSTSMPPSLAPPWRLKMLVPSWRRTSTDSTPWICRSRRWLYDQRPAPTYFRRANCPSSWTRCRIWSPTWKPWAPKRS